MAYMFELAEEAKVFWFFSSEKNILLLALVVLACMEQPRNDRALAC